MERKSKAVMEPGEFKRVRTEVLGMTQPELGERMGVSYLSIWRYETGSRPIGRDRRQHLEDIVQLRDQSEIIARFEADERARAARRRLRKRLQKRAERAAKRA